MPASKKKRAQQRRQRRGRSGSEALQPLRPQVAGIDLGSCEHWACGPLRDGQEPHVRVFGTTTPALEELADWLQAAGVESVAMESTHVY